MQLIRSHIIRGPFRRNRRFCLCNYGRCYRENYQRHVLKDGGVDYCRGCHRPGESMRHVITGRPPYSNVRPWNPKEEINCFLNTEADNHRDQLERTVLPPNVLASTEPETVSWCAQELQNMQIKDEGNQLNSNSITSFNGPSEVSTLPADNTEFVSY